MVGEGTHDECWSQGLGFGGLKVYGVYGGSTTGIRLFR